jgi:hypothetical protein
MANKHPAPLEAPRRSPSEIRASISRFGRRITELEAFDPNSVRERSDPRIDALEAAIDEALSEAFGHRTPDYQRYASARNLDTAGINYAFPIPMPEVIRGLVAGKERDCVTRSSSPLLRGKARRR